MDNLQLKESGDDDLPSYLVRDPNNVTSITAFIASMYAFTNLSMFCETTTADMMTVRQMMVSKYDNADYSPLLNYALGMDSGPCAFLTMLPVMKGQPQYVSVIHGLRQSPFKKEVYAFVGDTTLPTLPTIKVTPYDGLVPYFQPMFQTFCDSGKLESFYDIHSDDILLPNEGLGIRKKVRRLVYIPTVWVPAFAKPLLPNEARRRVIELC